MFFPPLGIPGSSSPQHLAAQHLPQCFLKPLTQSWQFGCNPQAVWAYSTAQTTAPLTSPLSPPPHPQPRIHVGRQDYPPIQLSSHPGCVWHRGVQDPNRARPFELPVPAVPCSDASIPSAHPISFVLLIPCYAIIGLSSYPPGDLFPMAFPTQTPNAQCTRACQPRLTCLLEACSACM